MSAAEAIQVLTTAKRENRRRDQTFRPPQRIYEDAVSALREWATFSNGAQFKDLETVLDARRH